MASTAPLAGITVVALEQAVAAPLASRHLADLGARVIKIERPGSGDFARDYDATVGGWSSFFVWLNQGKESLTLDLKAPEGPAVLSRLLSGADVLVHNLAPGAVERLGFGTVALRAEWPSLVVATITGYGTGGPWRTKKAYDLMVQAEAGLLSINGAEESMAKVPISVADIAAGMYTFSGVLASLFQRERGGTAEPVEIAMLDALAEWMGAPLQYTQGSGSPPMRRGLQHSTIAPYGSFPTADGTPIMLAVQNEREWEALCTTVLGRPDLAVDPRFAGNARRVENRAAVDEAVGRYCESKPAAEVLAALDRAGIANARINSVGALLDHPVLAERERWRSVLVGEAEVRALRSPLLPDGAIGSPVGVPSVGEHTDAILAELGYSTADVTALKEARVV